MRLLGVMMRYEIKLKCVVFKIVMENMFANL